MPTTTCSPKESTAREPTGRPAYFELGIDERGNHHVRDVRTESVHVVAPTSERERVTVPNGQTDAYVEFVADRAGWARLSYGAGLVDMLAEVFV